jgi:hypothetical protein
MVVVRFPRKRRRLSIRYYLITDEGPVRVPLRLHRDLVSGDVAAPQFANSFQRKIEVLIWSEPEGDRTIKMRPTTSRFDASGRVDLRYAAEAVALAIMGSGPKRRGQNVLDIAPTLKARRRAVETRWEPSQGITRLIRADLEGRLKLSTLRIPATKQS